MMCCGWNVIGCWFSRCDFFFLYRKISQVLYVLLLGLTKEKPKVKKVGLKWKVIFYTILLTFTWEEVTLFLRTQGPLVRLWCFVLFRKETESNIYGYDIRWTWIFTFFPFYHGGACRHWKLQWTYRSTNNAWLSTVYICVF